MTTDPRFTKLPEWAQEAAQRIDRESREAVSLCWPTEKEPVPLTSDEIRESVEKKFGSIYGKGHVLTGWFFCAHLGVHAGSLVSEGCSNSTNHCRSSKTETSTQGCGQMYRTKAEALLAARWVLCRAMATLLAQLDKQRKEAV